MCASHAIHLCVCDLLYIMQNQFDDDDEEDGMDVFEFDENIHDIQNIKINDYYKLLSINY